MITSEAVARIEKFVAELNATHTKYAFHYMTGQKFHRIVSQYKHADGTLSGRSSYCFVDNDGNVFKCAGWKAPAKGIRANLATLDVATQTDPYGAWLYKTSALSRHSMY